MHSSLNRASQATLTLLVRLQAVCLAVVIGLGSATAHELNPSVADLAFDTGADRFSIRVETNLEALVAEINSEHDDTAESPNADLYDALRALDPAALEAETGGFIPTFESGISIVVDGTPTPVTVLEIEIPETGDLDLARISTVTLGGALSPDSQFLQFSWDRAFGPVVLRTETDVANDGYAAYLAGGEASEPIAVTGQSAQSGLTVFLNYIGIGFDHILPKGLDHILFVVGLFLLSTKLRPLLTQITAFTLAHTVTLALGMLGMVSIPPSIVEPLIAASIVYVAVENILMSGLSRWRPFVVFVFGLLHGLGFAGVLTEFGIPDGQFVTALIGFNIGVEIGQLTVIAICFALVGVWFGNKDWYRARIVIPCSLVVAVIGAYWFVERTIL